VSQILFVEKVPTPGAEYRLADGATIGRAGADVKLSDPDVSRSHAVVRLHGGSVAIEDVGSTNGTFVNGSRVDGVTELRDGDVVRFGSVEWQLRLPAEATRVVPTVPPEPAVAEPEPEPAAAPAPPQAPVPAPAFAPPEQPFKRSAARRVEATAISYAVVFSTAVAVAVYFAQR
jgi:predicted component of type VI protein secretion system